MERIIRLMMSTWVFQGEDGVEVQEINRGNSFEGYRVALRAGVGGRREGRREN